MPALKQARRRAVKRNNGPVLVLVAMASSSEKKVSKSTLGLRFMQNALRAKQHQQLELEQAKVTDEAEWEIDPKIRETWGGQPEHISQCATVFLWTNFLALTEFCARTSVTSEPSYLPFLFPSLQNREDSTQDESGASSFDIHPTRGRRKFNKNGEEVALVGAFKICTPNL